MLPKVVDARYAGDYRVWLRFKNGLSGEIDLENQLWGEVFEPLKDKALFAQVRANDDLDTIVWPNGADFSPEWLWEQVKAARAAKTAAE